MKKTLKYILFAFILNFAFLININAETVNTCKYLGNNKHVEYVEIYTTNEGDGIALGKSYTVKENYNNVELVDQSNGNKYWTSTECPKYVLYETDYWNTLYASDSKEELEEFLQNKGFNHYGLLDLNSINNVEVELLGNDDTMVCTYDNVTFYVDHNKEKVNIDDGCTYHYGIDYSMFKDGCPKRVFQNKNSVSSEGSLAPEYDCSYSISKKIGSTRIVKTDSKNDKKEETTPYEEGSIENCEDLGETLSLVRQVYNLIKYLIPVAIIILSMVDFFKTIVSGEEKVFKEVWNKLVKRVIVGIVILLLPAILSFVIDISGVLKNNGNIEKDNIFCIFK